MIPALETTARAIVATQLDDGCIPWFPGGHADPWNMVEAAMGIDAFGFDAEARAAYGWLAARQARDGSWAAEYAGGIAAKKMVDANFCAFIAVGVWHHYLLHEDVSHLERMWPVVRKAIDFVLELQDPSGAIYWARDEKVAPYETALLTSCACICISLRCALSIATRVGISRPDWELSLMSLQDAVAERRGPFEDKDRYAMDWYYPVLAGAITGEAAIARLQQRWDEFVVPGHGCRCVDDRPWVTTGETAELVLALCVAGLRDVAAEVLTWTVALRDRDGAYWTGRTFPDDVVWPREKPTWGSGAILLAADATAELTPGSQLFDVGTRSDSIVDPL